MRHSGNQSYRSLALLCRQQAAISITPAAKKELERLAREYAMLADWLDRQQAEAVSVIGNSNSDTP
jgi:hypothetical protein